MRAAIGIALFVLPLVSSSATAQLLGRRIDVFATAAGVVGAAPVRAPSGSRVGMFGGGRLDAGLQGQRFGLSLGARFWEFLPTNEYGGGGLDGFFTGEWRVGPDTRSLVRVSIGGGFDSFDPGRGPYRENTGTSGVLYSFGFGRELFAPSGARVVASADIVMPNVNSDVIGRRQPVIEFGIGYRLRTQTIVALPAPSRFSPARTLP